jgi:hypothetical protein
MFIAHGRGDHFQVCCGLGACRSTLLRHGLPVAGFFPKTRPPLRYPFSLAPPARHPCARAGSHTSEDAGLLKAHAAEAAAYGLFTLAETGWVKRARGVLARTDTLVPLVNGIGVVGGLPLR